MSVNQLLILTAICCISETSAETWDDVGCTVWPFLLLLSVTVILQIIICVICCYLCCRYSREPEVDFSDVSYPIGTPTDIRLVQPSAPMADDV